MLSSCYAQDVEAQVAAVVYIQAHVVAKAVRVENLLVYNKRKS
jgi:hypothetical protein